MAEEIEGDPLDELESQVRRAVPDQQVALKNYLHSFAGFSGPIRKEPGENRLR